LGLHVKDEQYVHKSSLSVHPTWITESKDR
jgi:hypothetical protein